jgi:hypothetical protein
MSRKYQKPFIALWLVMVAALGSARAQESKSSKTESATPTKVINLWPASRQGPRSGSSKRPQWVFRS